MRPLYVFLLVAASQSGNAGPHRRDLDWDIFSPDTVSMGSGSTVLTQGDYVSNLDMFGGPATDSSSTGDLNSGSSSDYNFVLGGTEPDFSWGSDNTGSEGLDSALSAFIQPSADNLSDTISSIGSDLLGSDYIADSGCSGGTVAPGKVRRGAACFTGDKTPLPVQEPKLPTLPGVSPDPPPMGPKEDPPWIRFFDKPDPPTPNSHIADPRFDTPKIEEPEYVPTKPDFTGPCDLRYKYTCCELYGQLPLLMSDKPIDECVLCMFPYLVSASSLRIFNRFQAD